MSNSHPNLTNATSGSVSGPRRSFRYHILSVAGIVCLMLLVTEVILRFLLGNIGMPKYVLHPPDGRCTGLQPGTSVEYTGWAWRVPKVIHDVNGLGYRGELREREDAFGAFRILMIGDSYVYGQAVEADQTMAAHLERSLVRRSLRPIEVLNFGVPGLNLEEDVEQYRKFAISWRHDLVLLAADNNDLAAPICDLIDQPVVMWLMKHVRLARVVYYVVLAVTLPERTQVSLLSEERIRRGLDAFVEASRRAGARFAVFLVDGTMLEWAPEGMLDREVAERTVPLLVLNRSEIGEKDEIEQIPGEGHFSDEGNRLAAIRIERWLERNGLLPEP